MQAIKHVGRRIYADHNHQGQTCTGHNYTGRDYTGHNYMDHELHEAITTYGVYTQLSEHSGGAAGRGRVAEPGRLREYTPHSNNALMLTPQASAIFFATFAVGMPRKVAKNRVSRA